MEFKLKLKDNRELHCDSDRITIRTRKMATSKLKKESVILVEDKEVLAELEESFKTKPPTQLEIYTGYTRLVRPTEDNDDQQPFYDELCRICTWLMKDGKPERVLTEEEYQDLPYDVGVHISLNLFKDMEKSFLVVQPESN